MALDIPLAVCEHTAMRQKSRVRRGGAPRKAPEGLTEVLYVRTTPALLRALDKLVEKEREASPMRSVSRADLAREILDDAVNGGGRKKA
jgi:hypothetical protein